MTVKELLLKMAAAYRGFDAEAVAAMHAVFVQKLEKYEGAELANAWIEVASSFDAKPSKPYPLPKDFESMLPQPARMKSGPALNFKAHAERRKQLVDEWCARQRPEIEAVAGPRVAFACEQDMRDRAGLLAWRDDVATITLSQEDVDKACARLASSDRMHTFGAAALRADDGGEIWSQQMDLCRTHVLAGRYSANEIAVPVDSPRPRPKKNVVVDVLPPDWNEVPEGQYEVEAED